MGTSLKHGEFRKLFLLGLLAAVFPVTMGGCFILTTKVWCDGRVREADEPILKEIRVSSQGDICILYETHLEMSRADDDGKFRISEWDMAEPVNVPQAGGEKVGAPKSCARCLLIPHEALPAMGPASRLLIVPREASCDSRTTWNRGQDKSSDDPTRPGPWHQLPPDSRIRVLPPDVRADTYDKKVIEEMTGAWRRINFALVASGTSPLLVAPSFQGIATLQGRQAVVMAGVIEVPLPDGGWCLVVLPYRDGGATWWSYPIRVALTPPAGAVDLVLGIAVIPVVVAGWTWMAFGGRP